jgi:hypothetical protein
MIIQSQAADIARTKLSQHIEVTVYSERPDYFRGYATAGIEDCWYVYCRMSDEETILKANRVICVSKSTGKVVWEGSANDEG